MRLGAGGGDGHRAAVLSASEAMYSDFGTGFRSVRLPLLVKAIFDSSTSRQRRRAALTTALNLTTAIGSCVFARGDEQTAISSPQGTANTILVKGLHAAGSEAR